MHINKNRYHEGRYSYISKKYVSAFRFAAFFINVLLVQLKKGGRRHIRSVVMREVGAICVA